MNINGKTRLLGLIGNPIEHTKSPVIHNSISEKMNINEVYVPFFVEKEGLSNAILGAYELNILGLNVTVPYKTDVISELVDIDIAAKNIGAVNTLVRVDGGYKGYNTDILGLLRELKSEDINLKNRTIVILGAGGAAKAVAYMCITEGAHKIFLFNRTKKHATTVADALNLVWGKDIIVPMAMNEYSLLPEEKYIVFQTTSVGLSPNEDEVVIEDSEFYSKVEVGVDLIYNPATTKFMKLVTEHGGRSYNGLKMLLYQGIIAYELWNNIQISEEIAEDIYIDLYRSVHENSFNVVLIGFMGSGKTTVGKELAARGEYTFIDTDKYIENREGMTIVDIFEQKGETYFRELETQILEELITNTRNTIISTGGGMPLRRENMLALKQLGKVVYFKGDVDTIWDRLKDKTDRPLLKGDNPYEKIKNLLEQREERYRQADIIIDINNKNVETIVHELEETCK